MSIMQPIEINVHVRIGLDSALATLLGQVLTGNKIPEVGTEKPQKEAKQTKTGTKKPAKEVKEPETGTEASVEEAAAETPAEEIKQTRENTEAKEYTEEDVRAAMDRTRRRIEGEDYKENPDREGYKKYHRALKTWFKNTAALFGADKPSLLADSDSRAKFIGCCDNLVLDENGNLSEPVPY